MEKPRAMIGAVPVWCVHDEIVDCAGLVPNPKNPNTHPRKQIKLLGKIITQQGWRSPITVSKRSGFIVKGHGRLEAAVDAGILQAPVDHQDYESEAAEWADMVADNRLAEIAEMDKDKLASLMAELKTTDIDMELSGFSLADIDKYFLDERQGLTGDDDIPDPPEPMTKPGDLYVLGDHRLLCGDACSAEALAVLMGSDTADMVFTDPPYNVNYSGGGGCDPNRKSKTRKEMTIKNDSLGLPFEFDDLLNNLFVAIKAWTMGDVYVCGSNLLSLSSAFAKSGGHLSSFIVWVKNHFVISQSNYQHQNEFVLYGWFEGSSHYWSGVRNLSDVYQDELMYDGDGVPLVRVEPGGIESDIWEFPKPHKSKLHPTMKPVALCRRAIVNSSPKGGIVLDPFGGSGSTLIACEKTYRRCRMIELDAVYCDVIVKRWEDYTGEKAILQKEARYG